MKEPGLEMAETKADSEAGARAPRLSHSKRVRQDPASGAEWSIQHLHESFFRAMECLDPDDIRLRFKGETLPQRNSEEFLK